MCFTLVIVNNYTVQTVSYKVYAGNFLGQYRTNNDIKVKFNCIFLRCNCTCVYTGMYIEIVSIIVF